MRTIHTLATLISLALAAAIILLAIAGGEFELITKETFLVVAKPMGVVCFFSTFVSYIIAESK